MDPGVARCTAHSVGGLSASHAWSAPLVQGSARHPVVALRAPRSPAALHPQFAAVEKRCTAEQRNGLGKVCFRVGPIGSASRPRLHGHQQEERRKSQGWCRRWAGRRSSQVFPPWAAGAPGPLLSHACGRSAVEGGVAPVQWFRSPSSRFPRERGHSERWPRCCWRAKLGVAPRRRTRLRRTGGRALPDCSTSVVPCCRAGVRLNSCSSWGLSPRVSVDHWQHRPMTHRTSPAGVDSAEGRSGGARGSAYPRAVPR